MLKPNAKVLADSNSPHGNRLTTFEVTMHRFVLAEFNTHRAFSRNSASSRAIPVSKTIDSVRTSPALPLEWRAEQKGMQGGDLLDDTVSQENSGRLCAFAEQACQLAEQLVESGTHKSIVNRYLEPFLWHTVIVTSTDWDNFWEQRCSPLAQPEIRVAAECMLKAYKESTPKALLFGEWHTPLIQPDETDEYFERYLTETKSDISVAELRRRVSAARCARVSYLTHQGQRELSADLALYDRLVSAEPPHASPLEHVATPWPSITPGNFKGWLQLRHAIPTIFGPVA